MKRGKALITIAILMMSVMFAIEIVPIVGAISVLPSSVTNPNPQVMYYSGGAAVLTGLLTNPEYLKVRTATPIHTTTTIIVQGTDENGQNVQASVTIPANTQQEQQYLLNDTITNLPVVFASILNIQQQDGTHNDQIQIYTQPEPFTLDSRGHAVLTNSWAWPLYLGEFHTGFGTGLGWEPGQEHPALATLPLAPGGPMYYVPKGPFNAPGTSYNPPEPSNPDPLQVYINWIDSNINNDASTGDMVPEGPNVPWGSSPNELSSASVSTTLFVEGLDQAGNKLIGTATIAAGDVSDPIVTPGGATFSVVCNVWTSATSSADSYYIFTNPVAPKPILLYTIMIDHLNLYPDSYDILANPLVSTDAGLVGSTTILAIFVDTDNNPVWSSANQIPTSPSITPYIYLNFYTTGGTITPAFVKMALDDNYRVVTLSADSNARTIKVFADAIIPACTNAPALNLRSWIEITFDGVNSALSTAWPIHQLMWGYNDTANPAGVTLPVTPKPDGEVLNDGLSDETYEYGTGRVMLDGPIYEVAIPLYPGCNLISSPVRPMMGQSIVETPSNEYVSGYPTLTRNGGIPMYLLFARTEAVETIDSVWWYNATTASWYYFIPQVYGGTVGQYATNAPGTPMFVDGVGYWIKVEKACTLELSGVVMENAPFTPNTYKLCPFRYNLMGFTSVVPLSTSLYLEGLAYQGNGPPSLTKIGDLSPTASAVGIKAPVWVWDAKNQVWARDPATLWPTQGFWLFTTANELAP